MRYRAAALAIFLLFTWLAFAYPRTGSAVISKGLETEQQRRRPQPPRRRTTPRAGQKSRTNYSAFSHATEAHRQECSECHKFPSPNWKEIRAGKDAFAD